MHSTVFHIFAQRTYLKDILHKGGHLSPFEIRIFVAFIMSFFFPIYRICHVGGGWYTGLGVDDTVFKFKLTILRDFTLCRGYCIATSKRGGFGR